ncbi:MAG: hypothetical protein HY586_07455, partial [Candidatus Omnitrophica bacterium]|nr:hypothetical protein [Candidatus Omnitrophota bacterium]
MNPKKMKLKKLQIQMREVIKMFKRMIAAVVALGLVFSVPGLGYAAFTVRESGAVPVAATVPESLGFGINVNGDGTLNFNPT